MVKQYLEITHITNTSGNDDHGAVLPLTRVGFKRYEQDMGNDEALAGAPNEMSSGEILMMGSNLGPMAAVKWFKDSDAPEYQIHVRLSSALRNQYPEIPTDAVEYNPE